MGEATISPLVPLRFQAVAAHYPQRPAVDDGLSRLAYRELAPTAVRIGHLMRNMIRARAQKPGPVAICTAIRAELIALFLGVLHAGRSFLYFNPDDPPARQQAILQQSGASLLIADLAVLERFPGLHQLDVETALAGSDPSDLPAIDAGVSVCPADPCWLVQTSGSTGASQGVAVSHRTLLHRVDSYRAALGIVAEDRVALLASPRFGAAIESTFGTLLSGACLCPFDVKERGVGELLGFLGNQRISVLPITPTLFRTLARHVERDGLPGLRVIKLLGEPVYRSDVALFRDRFPARCTLVNGLGLSEAGGNVCFYVLPSNRSGLDDKSGPDDEPVPVGGPSCNEAIRIVDERGRPVAPGEEGEIAVRSDYLADLGWQSAEGKPHAAELRTGDHGKFRADGCLVHLGRKDRLVKLRGYRVDLASIEATLLQQAEVRNALVFCDDDRGKPASLVAVVEPVSGDVTDAGDLRRRLAAVLPDYMVPQRFVFMPRLPLTASGKIDRQQVRREQAATVESLSVSPRTQLETQLREVWSEVLGTPVGVYDHFFERGGTSLLGMDLMARLSRKLRRELPLDLLLNNPTVALMAESITTRFIEPRSAPWVRTVSVSLLSLREGGHKPPLVFIPGGYASEHELLVHAGLAPYLDAGHPVFGIRLGLIGRRVIPPWSIAGLGRKVVRELLRHFGPVAPVIIGECVASALAFEVGGQLAKRGQPPRLLILLDPWPLRRAMPRQAAWPAAVARYYQLSRDYRPLPYPGELHVIRCEKSAIQDGDLDPWEGHARAGFRYTTPGDHSTFLRDHRCSLAQLLNAIVATGGIHPPLTPRAPVS